MDKIYDKSAAAKMGIEFENQVKRVAFCFSLLVILMKNFQICIFIHSGSRGLGHQVATDALIEMEKAMARDKIHVNDRQLACARIHSQEGQVGRLLGDKIAHSL